MGRRPGQGRPVSRRSIDIMDMPGVRAARTVCPQRIRGQQAEQDIVPRQDAHHMEDIQKEERPHAGEWTSPKETATAAHGAKGLSHEGAPKQHATGPECLPHGEARGNQAKKKANHPNDVEPSRLE